MSGIPWGTIGTAALAGSAAGLITSILTPWTQYYAKRREREDDARRLIIELARTNLQTAINHNRGPGEIRTSNGMIALRRHLPRGFRERFDADRFTLTDLQAEVDKLADSWRIP